MNSMQIILNGLEKLMKDNYCRFNVEPYGVTFDFYHKHFTLMKYDFVIVNLPFLFVAFIDFDDEQFLHLNISFSKTINRKLSLTYYNWSRKRAEKLMDSKIAKTTDDITNLSLLSMYYPHECLDNPILQDLIKTEPEALVYLHGLKSLIKTKRLPEEAIGVIIDNLEELSLYESSAVINLIMVYYPKRNRKLTNFWLCHQDFRKVSFIGYDLRNVYFIHCNLVDVDFTHARLTNVVFRDCKLKGISFGRNQRNKIKHFVRCEFLD